MSIVKSKQQLPVKLEDLARFVLVGREKLIAVRSQIKAIDHLEVASGVREQKKEEAQMLAEALLDAEVRIGELTKEIEPLPGKNNSKRDSGVANSKTETIEQLGFTSRQIERFESLASHPEIVEKVKAEARENDDLPTRTEVLHKIAEQKRDERMAIENAARMNAVAEIDLRKGDFKKVLSDVWNIDAIITDPPYPAEYLDCFSELSLFASERLKEDGFCAVYSGEAHLPEVINRLSEHLTYVWTFCLYHTGKTQIVNGVNIMCGWKPILIFSQGRKKMRFSVYDVISSDKMEKFSHEWQQGEAGAMKLIEAFSAPGELVVDPFAGSGTFLKVAHEMGRRATGADL